MPKYPSGCPCNDCFEDENEWTPCDRMKCKAYRRWNEKHREKNRNAARAMKDSGYIPVESIVGETVLGETDENW